MIVIKSGRHPLAVTLLAFCAVSGISSLVTYDRSASNTIRTLPGPLGYIYFVTLTIGAVLALIGVFWPGLAGPLLERAGLCMLSGLLFAYGQLAWILAGQRAMFVLLLLSGFSAGLLARIIQIGRELRQIRSAAVRVDALHELGGPREPGSYRRHSHSSGRPGGGCDDAADTQSPDTEVDS